MRTKNKFLGLVAILSFTMFLSNCNNDDIDTTAPTIEVEKPVEDSVVYIGQPIEFNCTFTDNVELASYKIDIHFNPDGHTHEKSTLLSIEETPFSYSNSWEFEPGQSTVSIQHSEIVIADSINGQPIEHGNYHFGIYCSDKAGNEGSVFINIVIEPNGQITL